MQKKTKMIIITFIILTLIALCTISTIASVTINGKVFNNKGGDYYEEFGLGEMSTKDFYSIKYNDYKDTYFWADTRNDYRDYVENSKDGYCLNENVGTGSYNFYVANIIDIEGNKITFGKSGKSYYVTSDREKKAVANMAYALYARSNGIGNNSEWRRWMDVNGGWQYFYNTFKDDIDDEGMRGNIGDKEISTANSDYVDLIAGLVELKDNGGTNPIATTGSYKNGKYKTKIGPYSLQLNTNNKISTTVECISGGRTYKGDVIKEDGKYWLYLEGEITEKPSKITVYQSIEGYRARMILLGTGIDQARLIGRGEKTQINLDLPIKDMPTFETNVSLQKYITKVNGNNLTKDETTLTNRKNTYSSASEGNEDAKKHPSKNNSATRNYKGYEESNVVKVEAGDTVTYRIHVYNNSDVEAKSVEVRDKLLYFNTTSQYTGYNIVSITKDGASRDIKSDWKYVNGTSPREYTYTINNFAAGAETYFDITVKLNTYLPNTIIGNTAYINSTNPQNKKTYRTVDRDYIKMKPYKVSLQKIVYSVNENSSGITSFDRWNSWESNANIHNNPINETYNRNNLYAKHNNPVIVSNGDYVTYAIKVRNDGETKVNSLTIEDTLPEGLSEYKQGTYTTSGNYSPRPANGKITLTVNRALNPGQEATLYVTAKVSESNMSTRVLRNYAEITGLTNKNNVSVTDETLSNNQDADYIQLKDITIAGTVWNDKALDKKQDNYNGVYDESQENKLAGIKVKLYREGTGVIAEDITDENGNYSFDASKIDANRVTEQCERHIKAPYTCTDSTYTGNVKHGANYWKENSYYSYYIIFEYDGITYTSTKFAEFTSDNEKDSNAKEDNGEIKETRKAFNDRFNTINNQSGIEYITKNEEGYLPQSNHIYNPNTMAMQSSTSKITLSNTNSLERQLTHVNLGLRGRDVFDLELTSDVYSTKVTVNGQDGEYNYNSNQVTVRKSDIGVAEDMANFSSEAREGNITEVEQKVRNTDIDKTKTNSNYNQTGLGIEVTYKITVRNASQTEGAASKIVNYYDSKYTFQKAYVGNQELATEEGTNGSGYASRIITTPGTHLKQGETMDIYVVYTLKNPTQTLKELVGTNNKLPTYNMAEIYEYKTYTTNGNEAARGLLDKDSAPGSVGTEKVRLVSGTSNDTTVAYYFKAQNLSNLKYEDDTYATPTLYFTSSNDGRKLSGVVFRDSTTTDEQTRIKTGNGIKDEGEVGVYGATVELVELNEHKQPETIKNEEGTVRYRVTTNEDGNYTFQDFLPGNYVVRYHYGDTTKTVLLNQFENEINKYSFNGEDYQSTNNIGAYGAKKLNDSVKIWYAFNKEEGVSTGTDNEARREDVTTNVTNFTDEEMTVLNNVRDGKAVEQNKTDKLIADTNMFATTPNFTLTVEETVKDGNKTKQNNMFTTYEVTNMNFGISEVPVTTIDLQKHVNAFTITASDGTNIASLAKQDGKWQTKGNILPAEDLFDVSIDDEKLQGARLEVTYDISISMTTEKDFRNRELTVPTIEGIVDFVDNDLSYNESLGENSKYWKVDSYENIKAKFAESKYKEGSVPTGTVDSTGTGFTSVLLATENNPILLRKTGNASCPITLEKTLSSTESTVEDIITSSINTYEYDNTVEILKLDYGNAKSEDGSVIYRDRVRTPQRYIILAGTQHDKAISETITIHPPTGENNNITLYIIAVISLGVLVIGVIFIKKYAIKK